VAEEFHQKQQFQPLLKPTNSMNAFLREVVAGIGVTPI
jgi:hypothetical protein